MIGSNTRSWSHRRHAWVAVALALAVCAALFAPALPARAEIIDFDPLIDEVPEILEPEEILLLEQTQAAGYVFMTTELSPNGAYVQGVGGMAGFGFIHVKSGELVPLQGGAPGFSVSEARWISDTLLAQLTLDIVPGDRDEPDTYNYYRVTFDAKTGGVVTETFDVAPLDGDIESVGMGLEDVLVRKMPEAAPSARSVQLAPSFESRPRDVPDDLPGLVGAPVLSTIDLQQAEFSLALVDADGTNRRELLSLPQETGIDGVSWSQDGTRIAITTRTMPNWQSARPRNNEPVIPGTPNLNSINVRESLGLVSPDENPLVTGSFIHVFDVATGDRLATVAGTDHVEGLLAGLAFSPSSSNALLLVATRSELDGRSFPVYSSPNGLEYHLLDAEFNLVEPIEIPGGGHLSGGVGFTTDEELVFVVPDETDHKIVMYDIGLSSSSTVWQEPGAVLQYLQRGDVKVFSHSTASTPWELWTPEAAPGADEWDAEQLTVFNSLAAEAGAGLAYEDVSWRSSDGVDMHGVYVHDVDTPYPPEKPGPLVVWQLGGPGGQMTNDYGASVESPYSVLPHYGLPVLVANAAGRNVKSPDFYNSMADGDNFGQLDIAQIKEGVEHLVSTGVVHPQRVGVTGCSYGGYFTLQSMRTYPDLYAAGNPQCSLVDLTEEFTFGYTPVVGYLMGLPPSNDPTMEYFRDSPMYGVAGVERPMLIFHGMEDFLPVALMNNIHDDLDARDVEVQFLRMANEGHGYNFPESQKYAGQLQIDFFRRHLIEAEVDPWPPTIFLPATYRGVEP